MTSPLPADPQLIRRARLDLALGRTAQALVGLQTALEGRRGGVQDHFDLAVLLSGATRLTEAASQFAIATCFDDAPPTTFLNLARTRLKLGESSLAVAAFDEAIRRGAGTDARSDRLLALNYVPDLTEEGVAAEHFREGPTFGREVRSREDFEWLRAESSGTPVRIGVLSPDLHAHPIGWFLRPVLPRLRSLGFEILVYAGTPAPDAVTAELRTASSAWRDCLGLPDLEVEAMVLVDRPHVMLDMSGHTARSRIGLVARRLAPVQIQWIGYANTTGVPAVDFTIGDPIETPPESHHHFSEAIVTMPNAYVCYEAPPGLGEVGPPPCLANGFVTFGSLNNPTKIHEGVLDAWAAILGGVPGSRLLLRYGQYGDPLLRRRYESFFDERGISVDRVELIAGGTPRQAIETYDRIDVALDTFPYSGCTTTCEALARGVPVVCLPGRGFAGRHTASFLQVTGLSEWLAQDRAGYVQLAISASEDRDRLAQLRRSLPTGFARTPLGDADAFSRDLGRALTRVIEQWRDRQPASSLRL